MKRNQAHQGQGKPQTQKRIVEIRPGEGGEDAKLFCQDLAKAYKALCLAKG